MEKARANGALVIQKPQKINQTMFAFVQDHDGYKFKLIQSKCLADPLVQIMFHVQDLNRSINFYTKVSFKLYIQGFFFFFASTPPFMLLEIRGVEYYT